MYYLETYFIQIPLVITYGSVSVLRSYLGY
jgi:hypothetical protein